MNLFFRNFLRGCVAMLLRVNFYSISFFAFRVSVLLILAGMFFTVNKLIIRCIDNTNFRRSQSRRNILRNFLRVDDANDSHMQLIPTNPYNGSPIINKLIKKERTRIEQELRNLTFSLSAPHKLEDMLMESGGQPLRSLIISTWRSGTTFLGEILNAVPGNFYHYEPLLKYEIVQIRGLPHSTAALKAVKKMFKCEFDGMKDYFEYGRRHWEQFIHNTRLWGHCKYKRLRDLCYDASFTEKFCKLFPFQSMKVVRLRLRLVQEIITDKELNVKVVFLIRDPRGVMQSRQHRSFCKPAPDCWSPELLCADMISDYVAAAKLLKEHPQRLMVLRYEELALKPNETAHQILKFLGLRMMPTVNKFLQMHIAKHSGGVSSTFRVSREVPFKWKKKLSFEYVKNIQIACKQAMNLWGYQMAHNTSHMASNDFNPLQNYVVDV